MKVVYLIVSFATAIVLCAESPCTTPNNETATCKELTDCDILLQIILSKDPSLTAFLKASCCGPFMVCCGTSLNFTTPEVKPLTVSAENTTEKSLTREEKIKRLVPNKRYCGFQKDDDYLTEEKLLTSINEFPWLLYISLYKQQNEGFDGIYELRCTGVLINNRYALTASECNAIPFDKVQLGQYERFQNSSCETSFIDCYEPLQSYTVEEKIVHNNGILLLRLQRRVEYSDYVRPMCLPLEEVDKVKIGDKVVTSGWGDVSLEVENVKAKKKITHVLREPFSDKFMYVNSTNYTGCFGDEGGPLMHRNQKSQWFLDAILPPYFCLKNVPARRVNQEIIDWILENIRP